LDIWHEVLALPKQIVQIEIIIRKKGEQLWWNCVRRGFGYVQRFA